MEGQASRSVLIIDDDPTLREMYEEYLQASGFAVVTAEDGEAGLAKAAEAKPAIILLDLMMPKMNGIEVLHHLKEDAELKDIPVLVFTALIQDLEKQECFNAGAADYLVKTEVKPRTLLEKINGFIGSEAPTPATEETAAA